MNTSTVDITQPPSPRGLVHKMTALIKYTFYKLGVLPFLLLIAMVTFTLLSGNF